MRQAGEVTYADTHKGRKNEGVIEFRLYSDMKRALEKLDGTEVNGRKIRLIEDRPGARRRRSYSRSQSRSRLVLHSVLDVSKKCCYDVSVATAFACRIMVDGGCH